MTSYMDFSPTEEWGWPFVELKMSRELSIIDQDLFFLVFLDLRNAYTTLDQVRLLQTLEGHRAVPKMRTKMLSQVRAYTMPPSSR